MISNHAQESFDYLLMQAVKASIVASAEDKCEMLVLTNPSAFAETKIVMLTITSYLFRLMVFVYFTPDKATKEHFARINNTQPENMSEQDFYDAIAECGNIFCGALSRELGQFFPHRGMSTPNVIDKNCSSHLDMLGASYMKHFQANVNDRPLLHISLCICDYADLDFVVKVHEDDAHTGELELF